MMSMREPPTQHWSARREAWKDRLRLLLAVTGLVCFAGVILALVLPDPDAPSQSRYEQCLDHAADKAQGAVAIFNAIRWQKCEKLKPPSAPAAVFFDDLITGQHVAGTAPRAAAFLDAPLKPVTDAELLKQLNSHGGRPLTFRGYPCTVDCSGHAAGYNWAQRKDIDDEDDCTGRSQSFIEGCLAYVEERR